MTPLAGAFLMLARKRIFCFQVIKRLGLQNNQRRVSSLMFLVACFALAGVDFSVIAPHCFDVSFGLLVAGQAFVKVDLFFAAGMAFRTLSFLFFMCRGD